MCIRDRYYVGPVDPVAGEAVGPAGPTTAARMDKFMPRLLADSGLLVTIGKAERGPLEMCIRDRGKIAVDIMLMMTNELGEAFEPFVKGRGASSTCLLYTSVRRPRHELLDVDGLPVADRRRHIAAARQADVVVEAGAGARGA